MVLVRLCVLLDAALDQSLEHQSLLGVKTQVLENILEDCYDDCYLVCIYIYIYIYIYNIVASWK